jgi:putative tryptophan/tyrosine transport system substrate-binding protein
MKRRSLLIALGSSLLQPLASLGQERRVRRIGFLYFGSRRSATDSGRYPAFLQGMRELGYAEGKDYVVEARFGDGKADGLPRLAAELVKQEVDVIVTGGTPANRAAQQATKTIPIVVTISPDPVGEGLVKSLGRPGGNITGFSTSTAEIGPKQVQVLIEAVTQLSRLAVLSNPVNTAHPSRYKSVEAAARKRGLQVIPVSAQTPEALELAFSAMTRERADGLVVLGDTFFTQQATQIAGLAIKHRLPSINVTRDYPESGGLMSYGQYITENFRRAAGYVDRILKGSKPADLPIEQPTTFELVFNLKAARAIGLTVPPAVLVRADRIIQ